MHLDKLKKGMSTLEQVFAKTNSDIKINVAASETAQSKILRKFRQGFMACLILAAIFTTMALNNIKPLSFPVHLKIYLVAYLILAASWYFILYLKLKRINISTLPPAKLFSKTATIKILVLSGEIFFGIGIAILFTLLIPNMWTYNRLGFWAVISGLVIALIYSIIHLYPKYIKLFRELNSIN